MAKNTYECGYCGDNFKEWPSQSHKFCSKSCSAKSKRDRIQKDCLICGDSFETVESDHCETCSRECGNKYNADLRRNEERECENPECDNMFHSSQPSQRFCCRECSYGNRSTDGRTWKVLECKKCGENYKVKPSHTEKSGFCSRECLGSYKFSGSKNRNWQGGKIEVKCKECDSLFKIWPGYKDRRVFCSKECSAKWRSENLKGENHSLYNREYVECENCGETMNVKPSVVDRRSCCSKDCLAEYRDENWHGESHPNWKQDGGLEKYYGENWEDIRRKCLDIDGYKCVVCGRGEAELGMLPDVHHIIPLRFFSEPEKANYLANLVTLCKSCHGFFEGKFLSPRLMKKVSF